MNRIRVQAASFVFLVGASLAGAQATSIQVLSTPPSMRTQQSHKAEDDITINFNGRISPGRHIWVRVFNKSSDDLKIMTPIAGEKCVVFTQTELISLDPPYDGGFHIGVLKEFFSLMHIHDQTMTLVFEQGGDEIDGPLYLDRNAVRDYFAYAVPIPMSATGAMQDSWNEEAKNMRIAAQQAKRAQSGTSSKGFWHGLWGATAQAETPKSSSSGSGSPAPPVMAAWNPTPKPVMQPNCKTVAKPFKALIAGNGTDPSPNLEALAPVSMLVDENCKS